MQNDLPLVSVIIPTKDRCLLLQETLKSVQAQTYGNWEVIVVDDSSSDGTAETMADLCQQDSRIRYLNRSGSQAGAPACRNQGFQASTGEHVIFLDSDDLLAPYCLEQRASLLLKSLEYDFIIFPMLMFHTVAGDSPVLWNIRTSSDDLTRFLSFDAPWQTTCPIWKREAIQSVGLWDEEALTWQDWEFHIRALVHGLKYFHADVLPDCFLRRDTTSERISAGDSKDERFLSRWNTFEKIYTLLVDRGKLNNANRLGLAGLYFNNAENAAMRNKREIAVLFMQSLAKNELLNPRIFTRVEAYLKSLLFIKQSNVPLMASIMYRIAQRFLPAYLLNSRSNSFKHSLCEQDIEKICISVNY